ncbi:MAG: fructosamine kinase family protein [Candidatus Moeniiplasma glomeromycotorum]|nr:fructosamine kinase family protein [Candidatus Moeniiplasma glomeromycotorum]MCE8167253.1 fructosamine kinase family protein [Candidatus Moeniiplasma glomeromycotorum]MCE8168734.1 fructosamine kinase family protein [Candidatus Moeniiplasma glomeromycotorum]
MRFRKIVWIVGIGTVILVVFLVGRVIIFQNKKSSEAPLPEKTPTPAPFSPPSNFKPSIFRLDNIPAERSHRHYQNLTPSEEKKIIECLASRVNINLQKSYIDYQWGFNMIPAIREIHRDQDHAFYLFTDKGKFFVKVNNFSDLSRFEYEKESMLAINEAVPETAPRPLVLGNLPSGGKFLVVNFIEGNWGDRLKVENQKLLARSLAQLHQKKSPNEKFGFHIGKNNQWKDNWATFFLENRWQPLWKRVLGKYSEDQELKKWGTLIGEKVIPDLLNNLAVEPVLIHGNLIFDAWDINSHTNQPWLFDTYSYFGHNEMDLSLIHYSDKEIDWPGDKLPEHLKGEFFEKDFEAEYQKYKPLPSGFEERKTLYRLYNYLYGETTHENLIPGREYYEKILTMMKELAQKWN